MLVLDGAMGPFTDAARVLDLHHAYLDAGADIITTATFLPGSTNAEAARIARAAADEWTRRTPDKPRRVAGSIGPIKPRHSTDALAYREQVRALLDGGVDLLLLETVVHAGSLRSALAAIAEEFAARGTATAVMISASLTRDGHLLSGEDVEGFYALARTAAPFSVGLNCSFGARHLVPYVERLAAIADRPVSCHPSAGVPGLPENPADWTWALTPLLARGRVTIVGGCCGATPVHIRAIAAAVANATR